MFLWFNSSDKCNSNGKVIVILIVLEVIVIVIGFLNVCFFFLFYLFSQICIGISVSTFEDVLIFMYGLTGSLYLSLSVLRDSTSKSYHDCSKNRRAEGMRMTFCTDLDENRDPNSTFKILNFLYQ